MCCNFRERSYRTFFCATCTLSKGRHIFRFKNINQLNLTRLLLLQRRRNYLKPGFWNNAAAMIGKDPREMASFFGTDSAFGRYKVQELAPDPLLLPFLCNFAPSDLKCRQQDKSSVCDTATPEIER
uniref:Protein DEHYDRATION-INDUCED 19 homolog 6 n=1 Tax=Solanum tuberosum TaxID=4113 RepID=M1CKT9_SOLTU